MMTVAVMLHLNQAQGHYSGRTNIYSVLEHVYVTPLNESLESRYERVHACRCPVGTCPRQQQIHRHYWVHSQR